MGQAKQRGTYEERKAEGVAKAMKAEAERQERLRAWRESKNAYYSTPKGRKAAMLVSSLLAISGMEVK